MAKRKRLLNIDELIKEGRGAGTGSQYKPWIRIQDVPSLGRATRVRGIKTERQHELLSDLETNYFYTLEFADQVTDIREQYPLLHLEDTILIAKELGIDHPKHPKTGENIVMTTDFLITINHNNEFFNLARTVKYKDDLMDRRVLEKFEIERTYWEDKGVDWGIVTEYEIDKTIAQNISFAHGYADLSTLDSFTDLSEIELYDLIREFSSRIVDNDEAMRAICNRFDNDMSLKGGSGLSIFKHLIINKSIHVNMKEKIDVFKQIPIILSEKYSDSEVKIV